ncbi:MAG TPA: hypothetical protein VMW56_15920 [Candidatus Margulisiibacteriota bacterium]|nr:hypothetical protein [Candidatus Margulisiibacteriota bacterium]
MDWLVTVSVREPPMTLVVGRLESDRVQVPDPTIQPTPAGPIPSLYAVDPALLKSSIVT